MGEADNFLSQALASGHEGIMAKSLESCYQAGSRGADWFKIKPAHTVDLVVLDAESKAEIYILLTYTVVNSLFA